MTTRFDQIQANAHRIGRILRETYLRVPPNQRNYAWETKHVKDLFADLKEAINNGAKEYFLGSIVVIKEQADDEAKDIFVADGQQRLATTLMLLAAIRDYHAAHSDSVSADKLQSGYILTEEYGESEIQPHLRLNERDHEYFFQRVLLPTKDPRRNADFATKPTKKSHILIDKAFKQAQKAVKDIIAGLRQEQHFDQLTKWVTFLKESAIVVYVTVPDEGAAYTIFETMNDRGLALSATDLIKNYLFGKAANNFENVRHHWSSMMATLDTVNEDEIAQSFIRHFWISQNGVTRSPQLFDSIKKRVSSPVQTVTFSSELADASVKYVALISPSHSYWSQFGRYEIAIRKNLEVLNLFGVKQIRPLLLSAVDKFGHKDTANLMFLAVSCAIRLIISGRQGTGDLETFYGTAAENIYNGKFDSLSELSRYIKKNVPDDAEFQAQFAEANVSQASLARYYLRSLELQAKGDLQPSFIPNEDVVITLEHILPKDRSSGEWDYIDEETHYDLLYRLGNQVLLTSKDNEAIGNRGYAFKKPILAKSDFDLTKMAGKDKNWNSAEIENRQKQLAELAVKTWPLKLKY